MAEIAKAVVTGAQGFIGKNLTLALRRAGAEVCEAGRQSSLEDLAKGLSDASVVFHLAGVNRPKTGDGFEEGNVGSLRSLLSAMPTATSGRPGTGRPPVILASSTQAVLKNPYGVSKLAAEGILKEYVEESRASAVIFRLPGVFGKWCRPNYNSVVATFCEHVLNGEKIDIDDHDRPLELVYVDDVVQAFIHEGVKRDHSPGVVYGTVSPSFVTTLGSLAATIRSFKGLRDTLLLPDMSDGLMKRLYATYLSYCDGGSLAYALDVHADRRGSLAELLKGPAFGQLFVSRTKPGITRGNHYHDTKVEKVIVLEGAAVVRFRHMITGEFREYRVCGTDFRVLDIPPGWTHCVQNVGGSDMVALFWASEILDPRKPDTYPAVVPSESHATSA